MLKVSLPYEVKNADFWRLQLKAQITVLRYQWVKHSLQFFTCPSLTWLDYSLFTFPPSQYKSDLQTIVCSLFSVLIYQASASSCYFKCHDKIQFTSERCQLVVRRREIVWTRFRNLVTKQWFAVNSWTKPSMLYQVALISPFNFSTRRHPLTIPPGLQGREVIQSRGVYICGVILVGLLKDWLSSLFRYAVKSNKKDLGEESPVQDLMWPVRKI